MKNHDPLPTSGPIARTDDTIYLEAELDNEASEMDLLNGWYRDHEERISLVEKLARIRSELCTRLGNIDQTIDLLHSTHLIAGDT